MRNFITWVKGVLQMFFQRETIKRAVGAEVAISAGMQDAITLWQKMFCNEPPWLDQNTETLGLAAAVASEIARLVTVEFSQRNQRQWQTGGIFAGRLCFCAF